MELVLSVRQERTGPVDTSGRPNSMQSRHVARAEGRSAGSPAMGFDGARSRIVVLPSPWLSSIGGVRVTAWLWVDTIAGRHTIVEGYLAFALFVDADGSVGGTFYNGFDWGGVRSGEGVVRTGRWLHLALAYDGIDTSTIHVDGVRCGHVYSPFGPVQGVQWPYGLNIGAWPDADKRVFAGRIEELSVWRSYG